MSLSPPPPGASNGNGNTTTTYSNDPGRHPAIHLPPSLDEEKLVGLTSPNTTGILRAPSNGNGMSNGYHQRGANGLLSPVTAGTGHTSFLTPTDDLHSPLSGTAEASPHRRRRSTRVALHLQLEKSGEDLIKFKDRFMGKGKKKVGFMESMRNIFFSSWLNIFFIFIPFAWASHFHEFAGGPRTTFALCFFAIIPLERLFDYGGEQMSYYVGKDLGDLILVTLNNAVEATLAILLLRHCELELLKSTIVGVVILHLLFVPGVAFVTGGARVLQQDLHPHLTQLNHSLLTLGVLCILLPAAFFAALDTSFSAPSPDGTTAAAGASSFVSDHTRDLLLQMSHGLAVLLLIVYVCSRIYLHNPPGEDNAFSLHTAPQAPESFKEHVARLHKMDPEVNQWVCIGVLAISLALMATTAEFLVQTIDVVRDETDIELEWIGLILIPFVSFAADGTVAAVYFIRYMFKHFFHEPTPPTTLAKGEAIDLSIQFTLFWMPFLILLGWWTHKPFTLLFDIFEVAVLLGACFLVNYVTADSKTNWAEGVSLVAFYCMIALCAWFYPGQPALTFLEHCVSVADSLTGGGDAAGGH